MSQVRLDATVETADPPLAQSLSTSKEKNVTLSQAIRTPAPTSARHGTAATVAIAMMAGSTVIGLIVAAITFGALAIAFPIAVPIAQQYHVAVSANDVLLAERFASIWWGFAGASLMCLFAAIAVIVATVKHFESPPAV